MTDDFRTQQSDPRTASNSTTRSAARTPSRGRTVGSRACPSCGSQASSQASVCPVCGQTLQDRSGRIRCRHCGERSPAELTLCPFCGRELVSAPPRIFTWGIPVVLVALFLTIVVRQADGRNPVSWVQDRLSVEGMASGEASRGLIVVMTPAPAEEVVAGGDAAEPAEGDTGAAITTDDGSVESGIVSAEELSTTESEVVSEEAAAQPDDAPAPSVETTESDAAGAAAPDNDEAPSEAVAEPVTESTPEATESAQDFAVSAASASTPPGLPTATPANTATATPTVTETPFPTETPASTATPTPVPMPTYEIQRGDTLVVIARKNDVSVDDLMRVNDISAAEAFTIQPGQKLLIPVEGSEVVEEPATVSAAAAPAAVSPTNTPLPTPTTPSLRLDAPILRSPEPGTPVSCSAPTSLTWLPVPFMRENDRFVLHLGFVSGRLEDGRDIVIWVLEQPFPANVTSWDMDGSLCALAPQEFKRKWHWYVEVAEEVDGELRSVSPASETWHFNWN